MFWFFPYLLVLWILLLPSSVSPRDMRNIFFGEDFDGLENWKTIYFPRIKEHTRYSIETLGNEKYLKAVSHSSASGLGYKKEFNVYEYPHVRWRWKAENVYEKGAPETKEGDDYPIRVYITFKYDPGKAGYLEQLQYGGAKLLYGEYPPHSALNYVWANGKTIERIISSPYTEKAKIIILQRGRFHIGEWQTEEVNILKDYQAAFGESPPAFAGIAVMNDSDNTGEASVSYIDYIEVYK